MKNLDRYIGIEMEKSEIMEIFIDKWVIMEVTGQTPLYELIGKVLKYFDTEKEMNLAIRLLRFSGYCQKAAIFRGKYGENTPKPIHISRVVPYEK